MANSAFLYKSKSGNYHVSFHHPICREGTIGKKIHRSLKVTKEDDANKLRDEMNALLALADTPELLPTRTQAIAEGKYALVVIDAFFNCMTPEPTDYYALRETEMPLPPRVPGKRHVPRVLLVGGTGAGKSRFGQHFLGTTRQNYPMKGAGRTTVSDTETIVEDNDYAGIITFYSENEIRAVIKDNILEACAFSDREQDERKIAMKLLVDSDKRFRFNYNLGGWADDTAPEEDEDDRELDDQELDDATPTPDTTAAQTKLKSWVAQVIAMTKRAQEQARQELKPDKPEDEPSIQELWQLCLDRDQVDGLAEELFEELEKGLCAATGTDSWPVTYRIPSTNDKAEFFRRLRPFYQNHRTLFGTLVTPLVQGIRVRGRFAPEGTKKIEPVVLLDGQGVGHEQGSPTKINRTIPPELTKKFSTADLICLVDRAMPAMTGDAPLLLEHLIVRGHQQELALVFTHFEAVAAPDLGVAGRKAKVLEGVSNTIQAIGSLPKAERVILERSLETKAYFLGRLNEHELKKATQAEMGRLRAHVQRSVGEPLIPQSQPVYNEYDIAKILDREVLGYREAWSEDTLSEYHWKTIEALTNWIGNAYADGFPKRNLYPAQNLSQRLVGAVSIALEEPREWNPHAPDNPEEQSRLLNAIRSKVAGKIDTYCKEVLVRDPRTGHWLPAYQNISGYGTKVRRARTVARILEDRAELPNEGVGKFTKDIWHIVQETINEVCQQPIPAPQEATAS